MEQRRLRAEAEAEAECMRRDAEEHCAEQEWQERKREEVEARRCRSRLESTLTLVASPETELPKSNGKGPELALELEGGQESRRYNSCEKRNAECVHIKVSDFDLKISNY